MCLKFYKLFFIINLLPIVFLTSCSNGSNHTNSPMDMMRSRTGENGNPLIEYYTRSSVNTTEVTIRVKGKTSDTMDIAHTFEAGYGTTFPILGLYPNYLYKLSHPIC